MAVESKIEAPAIKALGTLFKLTKIFLWDDDKNFLNEHATCTNSKLKYATEDDYNLSPEDMELTEQMNALGLPVSFNASNTKTRRKGIKGKPKSDHRFNNEVMADVCKGNMEDSICRRETLYSDVAEEDGKSPNLFDEITDKITASADSCSENPESAQYQAITEAESAEQCTSELTLSSHISAQHGDVGDWKVYWDTLHKRNYYYNTITQESTWYPPSGFEYTVFSAGEPNPSDLLLDTDGSHTISAYSSFQAVETYKSLDTSSSSVRSSPENEFDSGNAISSQNIPTINCKYQHLDEVDGVTCTAEIYTGSDEDWSYDMQKLSAHCREQFSAPDEAISCEEHGISTTVTKVSEDNWIIDHTEKKKQVRRTRTRRRASDYNTELQLEGMPLEFPNGIVKYWCQRYSLFSKFDEGIKLDEEGWFSVTPEAIARHHAARCSGGVIVDSFTGAGGNAIQFAKSGSHVIAIDIEPRKIEYGQHNAAIYGVAENIDFIEGDFFQLELKVKADVVFLSPPWGGPEYAKVQTYNIETMLKPRDANSLFRTARRIASRIVMFLPRNTDINQLAELALSVHPPWALEVEKIFLNGKLKAVTAYFSDTTDTMDKVEIQTHN